MRIAGCADIPYSHTSRFIIIDEPASPEVVHIIYDIIWSMDLILASQFEFYQLLLLQALIGHLHHLNSPIFQTNSRILPSAHRNILIP